MKRPLFILAIAVTAGVIIQYIIEAPFNLLIFTSLLLLCFALILLRRQSRYTHYIIVPLFMIIGTIHMSNFQYNEHKYSAAEIMKRHNIKINKYCELVIEPRNYPTHKEESLTYVGFIRYMKQGKFETSTDFKVLLRINNASQLSPEEYPRPGDVFRVVSPLKPVPVYNNYVENPYTNYYYRKSIKYSISVSTPEAIDYVTRRTSFHLLDLANYSRSRLSRAIDTYFQNPEHVSLLKAMTLGIRSGFDENLSSSLKTTGIYHIVAISGLHVGILYIFLVMLLTFPVKDIKTRLVLTSGIILFFAFMVGFYPSVTRASLIIILITAGRLLNRQYDFLNLLGFSALCIIAHNPVEVFAPGFQLTFLITLGLKLVADLLSWERARSLSGMIKTSFVISLTAYLVSLPITIFYFNITAPIGILLNVIIVPFVFTILILSIIFFVLSLTQLPFLNIAGFLLQSVIDLMLWIVSIFKSLPFSSIRPPTPGWLMICFYFLVLCFLYFTLVRKKWRIISSSILPAMVLIFIFRPFSYKAPDNLRISILDVGQGESILIETPEKKTILIDAGGNYELSPYIGEKVVSRTLWKQGIKQIDHLILTHSHLDHLAGMIPVAGNFKVINFYDNGLISLDNPGYALLRETLAEDVNYSFMRDGCIIKCGKTEIHCLNPPFLRNDLLPVLPENDYSIVLMLQYGEFKMLLTGDLEHPGEKMLIEQYGKSLECDILKLGHHGSSDATSLQFLKLTSPEYAVASLGRFNRFHYPSENILQKLKNLNIPLVHTAANGRITIISNGKDFKIDTFIK